MKLSVTGSRHFGNRKQIEDTLSAIDPPPSVVIQGGGGFVDLTAKEWAKANGIPYATVRPARDDVKSDYLARNTVIVDLADKVIAFRAEGKSNGTDDTVRKAEAAGKMLMPVIRER